MLAQCPIACADWLHEHVQSSIVCMLGAAGLTGDLAALCVPPLPADMQLMLRMHRSAVRKLIDICLSWKLLHVPCVLCTPAANLKQHFGSTSTLTCLNFQHVCPSMVFMRSIISTTCTRHIGTCICKIRVVHLDDSAAKLPLRQGLVETVVQCLLTDSGCVVLLCVHHVWHQASSVRGIHTCCRLLSQVKAACSALTR